MDDVGEGDTKKMGMVHVSLLTFHRPCACTCRIATLPRRGPPLADCKRAIDRGEGESSDATDCESSSPFPRRTVRRWVTPVVVVCSDGNPIAVCRVATIRSPHSWNQPCPKAQHEDAFEGCYAKRSTNLDVGILNVSRQQPPSIVRTGGMRGRWPDDYDMRACICAPPPSQNLQAGRISHVAQEAHHLRQPLGAGRDEEMPTRPRQNVEIHCHQ